MSPELIGVLGVVVMLVLIAMRMWIGVAMGVVGIVGMAILRNWNLAIISAAEVSFNNMNNYTLTVIPMFALMGMVISESRIGTDLFKACNAWLSRVTGGLASATVAASALMAAVCGSHTVSTVILSKMALPEMKRYNYNDGFACATVAVGAPLSIVIPPSLALILYGIITEQPIGKLFIAGIIPGILMIVVFLVLIRIMCTVRPELGPKGDKFTLKEKMRATLGVIPVIILFVLVLGGIYMNVVTSTQSGAIGAAGAIIISLCYKTMNGKKFLIALRETAMTVGMVFSLLIGTYIFVRFVTLSGLPASLANFMAGLNAPLPVIMLMLALVYMALDMIMPEIAMIILSVPILFPAMMLLGFDPIWLGIYIALWMALAAITPPIGLVVFIISGMSGVSVTQIFKSCMPFIAADAVVIILVCVFPSLVTWLPSMMG